MLITLQLNKLSEETIKQYKANLDEIYGSRSRKVDVHESMYCIPELTQEQSGLVDNTGLYPMRVQLGLQNDEVIGDAVIVNYPPLLPIFVPQSVDNDDYDGYKLETYRMESYGYCETIPDFMALIGEQINKSKRKFFVVFNIVDNAPDNPSFIANIVRSDHSKSLKEVKEIYYYQIHEVLNCKTEMITPMQKSDLLIKELRGDTLDYENLSSNLLEAN